MTADDSNVLVQYLKKALANTPPVRDPLIKVEVLEVVMKALTRMHSDDMSSITRGSEEKLNSILFHMIRAQILSYTAQKIDDVKADLIIALHLMDGRTASVRFHNVRDDGYYVSDTQNHYELRPEGTFTILAPGVHIEAEYDNRSILGDAISSFEDAPIAFTFGKHERILSGQYVDETDPMFRHLSNLLAVTLEKSADINALLCLNVGKYDELAKVIQSDKISNDVLRLIVEGICLKEDFSKSRFGMYAETANEILNVLDLVAHRLPGSLVEEAPFYQRRIINEDAAVVSYPLVLKRYLMDAPPEVVSQFMETVELPDNLSELAENVTLNKPNRGPTKPSARRF